MEGALQYLLYPANLNQLNIDLTIGFIGDLTINVHGLRDVFQPSNPLACVSKSPNITDVTKSA